MYVYLTCTLYCPQIIMSLSFVPRQLIKSSQFQIVQNLVIFLFLVLFSRDLGKEHNNILLRKLQLLEYTALFLVLENSK